MAHRRGMTRFACVLLLGLAALGAAAPVMAQGTAAPPDPMVQGLLKYLQDPDYSQLRMAKIREGNDKAVGVCQPRQVKSVRLVPLSAISFAADGKPTSGMWAESAEMLPCDPARRLNLLTVIAPGKPIQVLLTLPGTTMTDALLQRDAAVVAVQGAAIFAKTKDCKDIAIVDTKFDDWTGDALPGALFASARPWLETWTVRYCDKQIDVPIDFRPDSRGTGFTPRQKDVRLRK